MGTLSRAKIFFGTFPLTATPILPSQAEPAVWGGELSQVGPATYTTLDETPLPPFRVTLSYEADFLAGSNISVDLHWLARLEIVSA